MALHGGWKQEGFLSKRAWIWFFLAVGLFLAALAPATAQNRRQFPLPGPSIPDTLGVNIHFTDPRPGEMAQLAAAGFRWVRMDFFWADIEREKGRYDFSAYDRLMAALAPYKIRPIFILDYGNDLYQQGPPSTDESRAAFARFAAAAVTHFRNRGILWEMWNEPNIQQFWPQPSVRDYSRLALAVGQAIRKAAPDEWYIGPATSTMDFDFLKTCFQAGLLRTWDAVSFHPYRGSPPETAAADYRRVRAMIAQYAPPGKRVPILSSEWGYTELMFDGHPEQQSQYLAREFLSNLANGLLLSIWYDWHDDGTDPQEGEHHFGTVYNDYRPKPAYVAVQTLTRTLNGFRFRKRLDLGSPDDYGLVFSRGKTTGLAVWTVSPTAHEVTIPLLKGAFQVIGATGEKSSLSAGPSGLRIQVTDAPQYLLPEGFAAR